ncbi:Ubiquitin carboxyl-terminal hydrolase 30 [Vanrija pseudolonga]|uniref:ubiquitinyl hydrolase 1 n=1 Tax=Vanrija pseudolonga TaxID=143232 RepID=A0AAF0YGD3_9TREE|nr:Ubiquitin carboxyl-terminal hydrolase 30 [Vanrija pseudolonga]
MRRQPHEPPPQPTPYSVFILYLSTLFYGIMGVLSQLAGLNLATSPDKQAIPLQTLHEPGDNYPGMVNPNGVLCFLNSVIQSLASLPTVIGHLDEVVDLATEVDIPTPITDELSTTITELNTGTARRTRVLYPTALCRAFLPVQSLKYLVTSGQQQDAHELYTNLAAAVGDEALKVGQEAARTPGLGEVLDLVVQNKSGVAVAAASPPPSPDFPFPYKVPRGPAPSSQVLEQPWNGLLARRRKCQRCGYDTPVLMDIITGLDLPIPGRSNAASLDACVQAYLAPEAIPGVNCDMCTLVATEKVYRHLASAPAAVSTSEPSPKGKKKRHDKEKRDKEKQESEPKPKDRAALIATAVRLATMVRAGVPVVDVPGDGVDWVKVQTDSVRRTAVVRAPKMLQLHFIRSDLISWPPQKKDTRIVFPLVFDFGKHMARGVDPTSPGTPPPQALYQLRSVVLHRGANHNSGHYTSIRRKPNAPYGVPGRGWLWLDDTTATEYGDDVFQLPHVQMQVTMLFYERLDGVVVPPAVFGNGGVQQSNGGDAPLPPLPTGDVDSDDDTEESSEEAFNYDRR